MTGHRDDPESSESPDPFSLREEWDGNAAGTGSASGAGSTRPMPESDSSAAVTAAVEETSKRKVRGVVRDIKVRTDSKTQKEKLTFRVERYNASGNRLPPVPVEMNRYRGGSLTDGDEVEIGGRWSHGSLRAKRIRNLTTLADIRGRNVGWVKWAVAVLVVLALGVGGFEVFNLVRNNAPNADLNVAAVKQSALPNASDQAPQQPASQQPAQEQPAPEQPAPATTTQEPTLPQQVTVENVAGRSVGEASNALESAGLRITIIEEPDESVPAGSVTRTDPTPGTSVDYSSLVKIYVSSGPASGT